MTNCSNGNTPIVKGEREDPLITNSREYYICLSLYSLRWYVCSLNSKQISKYPRNESLECSQMSYEVYIENKRPTAQILESKSILDHWVFEL